MYTNAVNNTAVINILESIKLYSKKTKFFQASSSQLFKVSKYKINENSNFDPNSPYAIAKLSAYFFIKYYRNNYNIFAANGFFFNHESPLRGNQYLTKKIIRGLLDFKKYGNHFYLGNLYSKRDWGDAKDYVEITYKIILSKKPNDYIISTGKNYSVKDFVNIACKHLRISIKWIGKGLNEKGVSLNNKTVVAIKKNLFRDYDLNYPISDCSKAKKNLGWKPKKIDNLIKRLINFEINSRS
jgi:GDPmannose 4,6-dehydratase